TQRIKQNLDKIVKRQANQKKLSDAIITVRNDRNVIPVKAEYRQDFNGIVHDQSASGQTLYIEQIGRASCRERVEMEVGAEDGIRGRNVTGVQTCALPISTQRIKQNLDKIVKRQANQKKLSDAIITVRNDRNVIPVKAEYRQDFNGIVHDQSASGQTLYIEPSSIVEMNNQ